MFNQYEPNVKATIAFVERLKVKVNKATINKTLQNHPDWPSLLCISDSLNKWNIPNGAGKIDTFCIEQVPTPFIACMSDKENPLAVVIEVAETTVKVYSGNYNKPKIQKKEDFVKKWDGIYLIGKAMEDSGEEDYKLNRKKNTLNDLILTAAVGVLIILSLSFLSKILSANRESQSLNSIAFYLQYSILVAGIFVTTILLWYDIDKNNPLLQKVCTGIVKGNCHAILSGKQAKIFSWLSWSEVGFFYFTGSLLTLLMAENTITNSISLISWLNILALPYILYSLYYQWLVIKQWCMLCLTVQALLALGSINVITNNLYSFIQLSYGFILTSILLLFLPVLFWYTAKPYILRLQEAKNIKREYLRIKFNTEIFNGLLKQQKEVKIPPEGLGIDLGNHAATNLLIKVCNPYCGPCSKAHSKIEKLVKENANLKVKIIFTAPNKEDHLALKPVRHLMAIAEQSKKEAVTRKALDDWYLSDVKDYKVFAAKYPINGLLLKQGNKIEAMDNWCKDMDIEATPTFFINGYQIPNAYNVEDLQYFLLE